jgi:tetratricopeptide (TPR) repeat protein
LVFEEPRRLSATTPADARVRASALLDVGRVADARALLAPALASCPDDVQLWLTESTAARLDGDGPGAVRAAERAIALQPDAPNVLAELAAAYVVDQRAADAVPVIRRAVARAPQDRWVQTVASYALRAGGFPDEALASAEVVIRLSPQDPVGFELAGRACTAGKRLPEAERHLRRALELEPVRISSLRMLGEVLGRQKRRAEAAEVLVRAIRHEPDDAWTVDHLSRMVGQVKERVAFRDALIVAVLFAVAAGIAAAMGQSTVAGLLLFGGLVAFLATVVVVAKFNLHLGGLLDPQIVQAVEQIAHERLRRQQGNDNRQAAVLVGIAALVAAVLFLFPGAAPRHPYAIPISAVLAVAGIGVLAVVIWRHVNRPLPADVRALQRARWKTTFKAWGVIAASLVLFLYGLFVIALVGAFFDDGAVLAGALCGLVGLGAPGIGLALLVVRWRRRRAEKQRERKR